MEKLINNVLLTTEFTDEDIQYSIKRHKEIFDSEFGFSEMFNKYVEKSITDFAHDFDSKKDFMLVAKVDGRFAGTITLIGEEDGKGRLRYFFVEPFTRGHGVGKLVFTTAMSMAKDMGYSHLYFSTYNVLKVARTMYRQLGFEITQTIPDEDVASGVIEEFWAKDI